MLNRAHSHELHCFTTQMRTPFSGIYHRDLVSPGGFTAQSEKLTFKDWPALKAWKITQGSDLYIDAHLIEHRTGKPPTQVRFPGAVRYFSPRNNFQCRLSYGVCTPPCAIACIYICAHVKDPVVHVRVRWVMETLKHPAYILGWVVRLCRGRLFPGKVTRISHGRNPIGTIQL